MTKCSCIECLRVISCVVSHIVVKQVCMIDDIHGHVMLVVGVESDVYCVVRVRVVYNMSIVVSKQLHAGLRTWLMPSLYMFHVMREVTVVDNNTLKFNLSDLPRHAGEKFDKILFTLELVHVR